jgi:hypothetical protein
MRKKVNGNITGPLPQRSGDRERLDARLLTANEGRPTISKGDRLKAPEKQPKKAEFLQLKIASKTRGE